MTATAPIKPQQQAAEPALLGLDAVQAPVTRKRQAGPVPIAAHLPVARVVLDLQPAHLDRAFDYLVPAAMDADCQPGVRIKARFGGRDVDGFVVERLDGSDHDGQLQPLRRLVSGERVLTPEVLALARAVAARYAGTLADVLRLAIPPRHARTEKAVPDAVADGGVVADGAGSGAVAAVPLLAEVAGGVGDDGGPVVAAMDGSDAGGSDTAAGGKPWAGLWTPYVGGEAFLSRVCAGQHPKAVWTPLPGLAPSSDPDRPATLPVWAASIAVLARETVAAGLGVIILAPDARDVSRLVEALTEAGVDGTVTATLTAEAGPAVRYADFLKASRGQARVVVGTRAAMFAPVRNLGLIVCWGDGEQTLAEPHAPYPQARDLLALRSDLEQTAYLLGSPGRTVHAQAMLADGWAREIVAPRDLLRSFAPRVRALTSEALAPEGPAAYARIPSTAWRAVRDALTRGPVLVQVPRTGYVPMVACAGCREVAACPACHGPLALTDAAGGLPQCRWCGRLAGGWQCPHCRATQVRAVTVGSARTAEELGRAFPGVPVRVSSSTSAAGILDVVPARPAIVVATPGAEPVAEGGYAAALLLDAAAASAGVGLSAATEALRRWLTAAHLVVPASAGGQVLLVGDGAPGPTAALVAVNPGLLASRELDDRIHLDLPPAVRVAAVTGNRDAVAAVVARVALADATTTLGPVDVEPDARGASSRALSRVGGRVGTAGGETQQVQQAALFEDAPVRVAVRVPQVDGDQLARQLRASMAVRSAKREPGKVRVQLDPEELL
ncbi:MAG: primosomal protein N' [Cellulomonadaceae bacterium]|jgi:primosomal protein N' (replication factor Y)|nr:primosomal protein N' [Cellulomonadaceae bacterium]